MEIKRSFVFAFKDPKAIQKLLLGGVFLFLFFTVYFFVVVIGYILRILYAALEGRDAALPKWTKLNGLFNEGLLPVLVILSYMAPLIGLFISEQIIYAVFGISAQISSVFMGLNVVVSLIVSFALPLALIRFVIHGSVNEAFNLRQILKFVGANRKNVFLAWGISLLTGALSVVAGGILLAVGVFFTSFFNLVIVAHLYAQAYRASVPFEDDKNGEVRSSFTIPPPLSMGNNKGK
jgi:hypothetical protein